MQFVSGSKNSKAIIELLSTARILKCAVAFWGGASSELFTGQHQKIKILCNLESGATNPEAIRKLRKRKNIEIKTLPKLHAKVYLSLNRAIVGSANLSANGLAFEDKEASGWIEAGIVLSDASLLEEIDNWFEQQWSMANEISEDILKSAEMLWSKRRSDRPQPTVRKNTTSLLEQLRVEPYRFKDRRIFLVIYRDGGLTDEGNEAFQKARHEIRASTAARKIGCYENWGAKELPEDAFIIDLYYGLRGGFRFGGLYQTPRKHIIETFQYRSGGKGQIVLCFKVQSIMGFKISDKDQALLRIKISELWNSRDTVGDDEGCYLPLYKASTILFGKNSKPRLKNRIRSR